MKTVFKNKILLYLVFTCMLTGIFSCTQKTSEISLDNVENAPILPGCNNLSQAQAKRCLIVKISEFITIEFNSNVMDSNASPRQNIMLAFKVNETGTITNIEVINASKVVKTEVTRLLKKIPKMKPATQDGKVVAVNCSFPVIFETKL